MPNYPVLLPPIGAHGEEHWDSVELDSDAAAPLIAAGVLGEALALKPPPEESTLLNLNTATDAELQGLKWIGKGIAAKLIKARPLESLEAAKAASGLRDEQWTEIEGGLTV